MSADHVCCSHTHTYVHVGEGSRKEGPVVWVLLSHRFALIWSGRERQLEDACSERCRTFWYPLCTQRGTRDREGFSATCEAGRLLIRAARYRGWFVKVRKPPLKIPGNACRGDTRALGSVNSHPRACGAEAGKEGGGDDRNVVWGRTKRCSVEKGQAQQDGRHPALFRGKENSLRNIIRRKINSLESGCANSSQTSHFNRDGEGGREKDWGLISPVGSQRPSCGVDISAWRYCFSCVCRRAGIIGEWGRGATRNTY